ncbi:MAG: amylo-alpha-1,6-glucosidase [Microscillaceae bacterium]|nr:amylo-alpha-1,6-glucosidase [Microscillaceae bacterium]
MSYLDFDKEELVNLEYSLARETIRTNRSGSFASSTIVGCNTRKYHGLLITPLEAFKGERHVLLSTLDATIVQKENRFPLGIHKFPGGHFFPKGHMYVADFSMEPIPKITYRIGSLLLTREILLVQEEEQILVRYELLETPEPILMQMQPFLAFRNIHQLSQANMDASLDFGWVKNGVKLRMYAHYPYLFLQSSKAMEFVPAPDWHYNVEYPEEQKRGYEYQEDLFMPGYFELSLKKGDSFIFSASLKEAMPVGLKKLFDKQLQKRIPRNSYENCLLNSAQQFLLRKEDKTELIAGYPWFEKWGRDTFIALPGLTLAIEDTSTCREILESKTAEIKGGLFINNGETSPPKYNSADAPLWFIWALQQYTLHTGQKHYVWERFGLHIQAILDAFRHGTEYNIQMLPNGLIYAGVEGEALTWMDSSMAGHNYTARIGCPVEINALWYNALCFALELAQQAQDATFEKHWKDLPPLIAHSFREVFWSDEKQYLADYVREEYKDWAVRPNQVFATSLAYSPLSEEQKQKVLEIVEDELLTPKGLRTLSPAHPDYKGLYEGSPEERDAAYHQGTVWPWLLGHFCEGLLKIYGPARLALVEEIYLGFEEEMWLHGLGSISEIYDGNPPHRPNGAISQAWSVAELLRIRQFIQHYRQQAPALSAELEI